MVGTRRGGARASSGRATVRRAANRRNKTLSTTPDPSAPAPASVEVAGRPPRNPTTPGPAAVAQSPLNLSISRNLNPEVQTSVRFARNVRRPDPADLIEVAASVYEEPSASVHQTTVRPAHSARRPDPADLIEVVASIHEEPDTPRPVLSLYQQPYKSLYNPQSRFAPVHEGNVSRWDHPRSTAVDLGQRSVTGLYANTNDRFIPASTASFPVPADAHQNSDVALRTCSARPPPPDGCRLTSVPTGEPLSLAGAQAAHIPTVNNATVFEELSNNPLQTSDPVYRLANLLSTALRGAATVPNVGSPAFANRLADSKVLPRFSGDPLDWNRFKCAYECSISSGNCSKRESLSRLYDALRDEALDAVKTLFISCEDPDIVMQTLELRFGNPRLLAGTILDQIRELPNLNDDMSRLVEFATKLRNAVTAIKSIGKSEGYLHNPDLLNRILCKLPHYMLDSYARYRPDFGVTRPDLELVTDFMIFQARINIDAGTIPLRNEGSRSKRPRSQEGNSKRGYSCVAQLAEESEPIAKRSKFPACLFCKGRSHVLRDCHKFRKERVTKRWKIAKELCLCYLCLDSMSRGHSRRQCRAEACSICGKKHHSLLHYSDDQKPRDSTVHPMASDGHATERSATQTLASVQKSL